LSNQSVSIVTTITSIIEELNEIETALLQEFLECAYISNGLLFIRYEHGSNTPIKEKLAEKLNVSPNKIRVKAMTEKLINKRIFEKHPWSLRFSHIWGQGEWRNLESIYFDICLED